MDAELRYTPDEFFDRYVDFLKDTQVQHKLAQRGIRTWEHEELLLRFIAYVKNVDFIAVKKAAEIRKVREWEHEKRQELEEKKQQFREWLADHKKERAQRERRLEQPPRESPEVTEPTGETPSFGEPGDGTLFTPYTGWGA